MKILISPDKFKGSLSAQEVCDAIAKGIYQSNNSHSLIIHPLADGGDGSLNIIEKYIETSRVPVESIDPLGRPINTYYLQKDDSAFIELSYASGHVLLTKEEQNPMFTSTKGTGIMIMHAIKSNLKNIYLFLGGSATNDAGIGILTELGFGFFDNFGNKLSPIGKNLIDISEIRYNEIAPLNFINFHLVCDVDNPLHGPSGAAFVYAAQKGANQEDVLQLDKGLENFADLCHHKYNTDIQNIKGAGAAGGIPGGLFCFLNSKIISGAEFIMNISGFSDKLKQSDIVITGEGSLDAQSKHGKLSYSVYKQAKLMGKPCWFIVGKSHISDNDEIELNKIYSVESLASDITDSMNNASDYVTQLSYNFSELLKKP